MGSPVASLSPYPASPCARVATGPKGAVHLSFSDYAGYRQRRERDVGPAASAPSAVLNASVALEMTINSEK